MKINIVSEYNGISSVRKINSILGTNIFPELLNASNTFDLEGINIFVADYTPVQSGNHLPELYFSANVESSSGTNISVYKILKEIK